MKLFDLATGLALGFSAGLLCRDVARLITHYWPRRRELLAAYLQQRRLRRGSGGPQPPGPVVCGALPPIGDVPCGMPFTPVGSGEHYSEFRCSAGHRWRWYGPHASVQRANTWQLFPDSSQAEQAMAR
ncbi:MAG TPA: hypothetical protein VNJ70_17955 [Thermoanaerobaculia bacterium]|nr:hypothetical protein [Thermoanaerobaculia bacterium]